MIKKREKSKESVGVGLKERASSVLQKDGSEETNNKKTTRRRRKEARAERKKKNDDGVKDEGHPGMCE